MWHEAGTSFASKVRRGLVVLLLAAFVAPAAAGDNPVDALASALDAGDWHPASASRGVPDDAHHAMLLASGTWAPETCEAQPAIGVAFAIPAPPSPDTVVPTAGAAGGTCLDCHGNAGFLMGNVQPAEAPPEDGCAAAPSRPPFIGKFVNADFPDSLHGRLGCVTCHGGDDTTDDFALAHANQKPAHESCATCHGDIVERHETSLHHTLRGMAVAVEARSGPHNFDTLDPAWEADCASCHTECSDCHVTLPEAVGGGLIKGHAFFRIGPMEETCGACHGSRAGGEYLGHFDGIAPDVHFEAGMHCVDCHTNDLHGDGNAYTDRWEVAGRPSCTDCHAALPDATVMAHNTAHEDVSCQVCHGQPYQNCFSCHAGEEDGAYFRRAGAKELMFKVGRNTVEGYPYDIVPLRSNPVARHTFDYLGEGLLPDFDAHPTWKTAAPHNIQRVTPQNQSCAACHDDPSIFLGEDDLDPDGAAANADVLLRRDAD